MFRIYLLSLTLALALVSAARAQESRGLRYPDTTAGRAAEAWFKAQNAGTDEAATAFEKKWRSAEELAKRSAAKRIGTWRQIRGLAGKLLAERLLSASATKIAILARGEKLPVPFRVELTLAGEKLRSIAIRPASRSKVEAKSYSEFEDVRDLLAQVRKDTEIPAIAAAVVVGDEIVDHAVVGVRAVGSEDAALATDRFHVGSVTKSMTATMLASLVEEKKLSFEATLAELLPDVEMAKPYRKITLTQLLRHRAGVPAHATFDDAEMKRLVGLPGGTTEQRALYVKEVLSAEPAGAAGDFRYSNAGYAVAGYIAERVTGQSWEELMRKRVFAPLGMKTADTDWPATKGRPKQPLGHFPDKDGLRAQRIGDYPLGAFIGPAGNVCCSIADFARYARAHLRGLGGHDGVLTAKTVAALHEPHARTGQRYAAGWIIREIGGEMVHWHNGSAGTFFAAVAISPEQERAVVVAMNTGLEGGPVSTKIIEALQKRHSK